MNSISKLVTIGAVAGVLAGSAAMANGFGRPVILPQAPEPYAELSAGWWQWAWGGDFSQVEDLTGEFCDVNQPDEGIWYLAGTFGVEGVTRTCTIPAGRQLGFPLLNGTGFCPYPNETVDELKEFVADAVLGDMPEDIVLEARVDGVPVERLMNRGVPRFKRLDLFGLRAPSEAFSLEGYPLTFTDIDEDGDGIPEYEEYPCPNVFIADGYYVLLEPLTPGAHTIEFSATRPDGFAVSVTYFLTVLDEGTEAPTPNGSVATQGRNRFVDTMRHGLKERQ